MAPQADQESGDRGHRQVEHTADLALEIWAPSEEEVLEEGLKALVGILTGGARVAPRHSREVAIEALDPEDRLVRWLNEVLYLATVERFLACEAQIQLTPGGIHARLRGETDGRTRLQTEVKSVTYHGLALSRQDGGLIARVVLDV
jgi:SHS2 domain-containing protein